MQEVMRLCYNLSKSPRLDIVAEDAEGTLYEIEVQRLEEPAPARRVRF